MAKTKRQAIRERAPENPIRYVETSALLASLLEGDSQAQESIRALVVVTSSLTHAEAARVVTRARATGRLSVHAAKAVADTLTAFAERCDTVPVTNQILERSGRAFLVEPVRTLDAIHLATIEVLVAERGSVTVVTRDARVRANARAMGWAIE